ncbi:IclR family transcriptional regulator [Mycetocola sp.]|uniref:IclR family transcriptional regulator n=1 Tax=Mycetocola sp. TaxID=1871042 RepID=UPI003989C0DB
MSEREPQGDIQVLARCAQILRALEPGDRIQLGRLATDLEVGRSTLHRYLVSMANLEMITRVGEGEYVLGPLLAQLGAVALNRDHALEAASRAMKELSASISETTVVSVWGGNGAVVSLVESPEALIQVLVRVGSVLPPYAAQTIAFLAFLPSPVVDRVLDGSESRPDIIARIDEARRTGLVSVAGFVEGLETMAAPIFDASGVVATLATIGTEARFSSPRRERIATELSRTATEISSALGWRGSVQP